MLVNKSQLMSGIASFALNDVAPAINDNAFKVIVIAGASLMQRSEPAVDKVLDNGIVKMLLPEHGGMYDLDAAFAAVRDAIAQCGSFTLTIDPIPLIMKSEKTLTFTAADVDTLMRRMEDVSNG